MEGSDKGAAVAAEAPASPTSTPATAPASTPEVPPVAASGAESESEPMAVDVENDNMPEVKSADLPENEANKAQDVVDSKAEESKEEAPAAPESVPAAAAEAADTENKENGETIEPKVEDEPDIVPIKGDATEGTGTSLTGQVQKIIAKELEIPAKKSRIDLQSIPTRQYLDQTVVPILLQAMAALSKERPPQPIEFLAAYLLKHKSKFDM